MKIDAGMFDDFGQKAYWVQIYKLRFGVFVSPASSMLSWGIKSRYGLGWMVSVGPFQICYYRYA